MTGRLFCPDRAEHVSGGSGLVAATASMGDAERAVAFLAEGQCPACPHVRLAQEAHTRYELTYTWARCECCGALWELDRGTYHVHERGRLLDSDGRDR